MAVIPGDIIVGDEEGEYGTLSGPASEGCSLRGSSPAATVGYDQLGYDLTLVGGNMLVVRGTYARCNAVCRHHRDPSRARPEGASEREPCLSSFLPSYLPTVSLACPPACPPDCHRRQVAELAFEHEIHEGSSTLPYLALALPLASASASSIV